MDKLVNSPSLNLWDGFKQAFTVDHRTLALFRVILACIVLVDLLFRSQYFTAFFTDQGVLPRKVVVNWFANASYSLYFINGSVFFSACVFLLSVFFAFCLALGYRTRLATFFSWVLLVSLHHRTSILSSGADDLMRLLLFWGMFLPLGARYSIDAALEKHRPYPAKGHFSLASFAMLMQVLYVYWVGALLKTDANWQEDFTAVYFALNAEHFSTNFGLWVVDTFSPLLPYLTRFVLYIEQYGPIFMVSPIFLLWFRTPILLFLIFMHIGFVLLLNVGHFPYVSICSLLLFLPKEFWERLSNFSVFKRDVGVTVFYDERCDFCLKIVKIIKSLCVLSDVSVLPAQGDSLAGPLLEKHDSWVVQKANGETVLEWSALAYLMSLSPIFFWLSWPFKMMVKLGFGDRLYHFIGNRRMTLGKLTAKIMPWRESSEKTSVFTSIIVFVFFGFCFYINIQSAVPDTLPKDKDAILHVKRMLGLWQKWDMFAPKPVQQTRWPIFEGTTYGGQKIDVFRHEKGSAPSAKPEHILSDYKYYRWRKYIGRIYLKKYSYLRQHYVNYECRLWNKDKPVTERIKEISLRMGTEVTLINQKHEKERIQPMGTYRCR